VYSLQSKTKPHRHCRDMPHYSSYRFSITLPSYLHRAAYFLTRWKSLVHYMPQLVPFLSQLNLVHNLTTYTSWSILIQPFHLCLNLQICLFPSHPRILRTRVTYQSTHPYTALEISLLLTYNSDTGLTFSFQALLNLLSFRYRLHYGNKTCRKLTIVQAAIVTLSSLKRQ
jgi:hypothetical protein